MHTTVTSTARVVTTKASRSNSPVHHWRILCLYEASWRSWRLSDGGIYARRKSREQWGSVSRRMRRLCLTCRWTPSGVVVVSSVLSVGVVSVGGPCPQKFRPFPTCGCANAPGTLGTSSALNSFHTLRLHHQRRIYTPNMPGKHVNESDLCRRCNENAAALNVRSEPLCTSVTRFRKLGDID